MQIDSDELICALVTAGYSMSGEVISIVQAIVNRAAKRLDDSEVKK